MDKSQMKVFLIDDSPSDLKILELMSKKVGLEFKSFDDARAALDAARSLESPCLLICDINMPQMDGFELLRKIKEADLPCHVVFVSGQTEIDFPIRAMRLGASDYLTKPLDFEVFEARILKALENMQTSYELRAIRQQIFSGHSFESFVGKSEAIQRIYSLIMKISDYDATVLITGESGVGKERVARSIHERSKRSKEEFIAVNCASLPENLIESELFGYVRGAFTGAEKDTPGLFMAANKGTLFLDEIGELPLHLQAKILRVLQEREVRPVGSKKSFKVDVRIICATHRNLEEMVAQKKFRENLYFRLNVIPIYIPPLRERKKDLEILVPHILGKLNERWGLTKTVSEDAWKFLQGHSFPGNVRELENMLERAYIFASGRVITAKDLNVTPPPPKETQNIFNLESTLPSLREVELAYIREILRRAQTKEEAADILGIGRKTLYRKEFEIQNYFSNESEPS
jgi:DNA-binding NtrC family response regulator